MSAKNRGRALLVSPHQHNPQPPTTTRNNNGDDGDNNNNTGHLQQHFTWNYDECRPYFDSKSAKKYIPKWIQNAATSIRARQFTKSNPFMNNSIRTAKYTLITFLPKQLFVQFSKFANLYFLFISCLQAVPGWSPTGRFTTIVPLGIFVSFSMAREALADYKRHRFDSKENNTNASKLCISSKRGDSSLFNSFKRPSKIIPIPRNGEDQNLEEIEQQQQQQYRSMPRNSTTSSAIAENREVAWETVPWRSLKVGDIVKVKDNEFVPADIIVLSTENEDGSCFIETANLDGETNLKQRDALPPTSHFLSSEYRLGRFTAKINAESPNGNLYHFEGSLEMGSTRHPLTINQLLLRGSTMLNSGSVIGCVVYTGEESKIRMNSNEEVRAKSPLMEKITNKIVLLLFSVVLTFAAASTIASYFWEKDTNNFEQRHWYLQGLDPDYAQTYFSFVILFNTLIPISLYVTLEMVKMVQIYFMNNDLMMYDEKTDRPAEAKTSNINEDLGQIQYIFSDKTGTLTENVMIFRKMTFLETPFSITTAEHGYAPALYHPDDCALTDVIGHIRKTFDANGSQRGLDFLKSIALCHSCTIDRNSNPGTPQYQASSPDDVALVSGARDMGCIFNSRVGHIYEVVTNGESENFELLQTIEFSSKRRRMSAIYKYPDGRIMLLVKGADSAIIELLCESSRNSDLYVTTMQHIVRFASEGLRTLMYGFRELSQVEYDSWAARYLEASISIEDRAAIVESVAAEIERDFVLLGATAIEDKLQHHVPETIDKIRRAGIHLWMLTGDKKETAVNIGGTCQIIKESSKVLFIEGKTLPEVTSSVDTAAEALRALKGSDGTYDDSHVVLVVEGRTFTMIQQQHTDVIKAQNVQKSNLDMPTKRNSLLLQFLDAAVTCDNVICCRFSPSQKSTVVSKVKKMLNASLDGSIGLFAESVPDESVIGKLKSALAMRKHSGVTLAIGDGANDIPMLESAHVGIGITGREGLAAARAADYSFGQFRFLQPLLFVHGRYSYQRTALFTLGTFYKSVSFYICQMVYQFWTGWSGTSFFEPWTQALYNILFSSLPVLIVGMFEKDLNISTLLNVPELYRSGQVNLYFNIRTFWRWVFQGLWHAAVATVLPCIAYNGLNYVNLVGNFVRNETLERGNLVSETFFSDISGPFQDSSGLGVGTMAYSITILIITIKIGFIEARNWTVYTFGAASLSIGVWWLYHAIYDNLWPNLYEFGYEAKGLFYQLENIQVSLWGFIFVGTLLAVFIFDYTFSTVVMLWSNWRHHLTELRYLPLSSLIKRGGEQEGNTNSGSSDRKPSRDNDNGGGGGDKWWWWGRRRKVSYSDACQAAAVVGREWRGDWTAASPWFQDWERIHGIKP